MEKDDRTMLTEITNAISEQGKLFADSLAPLAAIRRGAASHSYTWDDERKSLLFWLLVYIFIAAFALGTFEHWHPQADRAHGAQHDASGVTDNTRSVPEKNAGTPTPERTSHAPEQRPDGSPINSHPGCERGCCSSP